MIIKDEGVVKEKLQNRLVTSSHIEVTLWSHNVSASLRKGESVLNKLAFTVVMQNLIGVNELGVLL